MISQCTLHPWQGVRPFRLALTLSLLVGVLVSLAVPISSLAQANDAICVGDCNGNQEVSAAEIITLMNIALGSLPVGMCRSGNPTEDDAITIDEIVAAQGSALRRCAGEATPSVTSTPTATTPTIVPMVLLVGDCARPGSGTTNLEACEDKTVVTASRCEDAKLCLRDAAKRKQLGTGEVSGQGRFGILVAKSELSANTLMVFEAAIEDALVQPADIIYYRDYLSITLPRRRGAQGDGLEVIDAGVRIDPVSEGALLAAINFSLDTAAEPSSLPPFLVNLKAKIDQRNAPFAGLTVREGANRASKIANRAFSTPEQELLVSDTGVAYQIIKNDSDKSLTSAQITTVAGSLRSLRCDAYVSGEVEEIVPAEVVERSALVNSGEVCFDKEGDGSLCIGVGCTSNCRCPFEIEGNSCSRPALTRLALPLSDDGIPAARNVLLNDGSVTYGFGLLDGMLPTLDLPFFTSPVDGFVLPVGKAIVLRYPTNGQVGAGFGGAKVDGGQVIARIGACQYKAVPVCAPVGSLPCTPTPTSPPIFFTPTASLTSTPTSECDAAGHLTCTPTPSPTETPTRFPSSSPSPTPSSTPTPSSSPPIFFTRTASPTSTPTPECDAAGHLTCTPTPSPTRTPTRFPSSSPSRTPSLTATQTQQPTLAATATPTRTHTPTCGGPDQPACTATPTATATASSTPTGTRPLSLCSPELLPAGNSITGTTSGRRNDVADTSCGGAIAPDAAFEFIAPASGSYRFDTIGSAFDTVLSIRNGTCDGTQLACSDDAAGGAFSALTLSLQMGQHVVIVVDGFSADSYGPFTLRVTQLDASNLLQNGSFEDGQYAAGGTPLGWRTDAFAGGPIFTWDNAVAHDGSKSIRIEAAVANDARWVQTVAVEPDTDYRLSGWVKTDNVMADPGAFLNTGANLSILDCFETGCFIASMPLEGTNDWTRISFGFNSGSAQQVSVAARLGIYSGGASGTAWFDALQLERISASLPSDLVVTGLFGPATAVSGDQANVFFEFFNQGDGNAGAFVVRFYFSADSVITTDDPSSPAFFPFSRQPSGTAGGSGGLIPVPANLPPGEYYLGAIVDADQQLAETREDNNTRVADTGKIILLVPPSPTAIATPYPGPCCESHPQPGCGEPSCEACVCGIDSYCCANTWDAICVGEAQVQCAGSCSCALSPTPTPTPTATPTPPA